jgi:G3E family GTPase
LLLNKTDLVSETAAGAVEATLRRMNPTARLLRTVDGAVDLAEVLETGLFDPVLAANAPGWEDELAGGHLPETEEYGIRSLTYRADRPFHPLRLEHALKDMRGVMRSKGFCWIASRPDIAALWSQAGPNLAIDPAQYWRTADMPPGQEIVFIGVKLDIARLRHEFDAALLTDAEMAAGEANWGTYPDPFPEWGVAHAH